MVTHNSKSDLPLATFVHIVCNSDCQDRTYLDVRIHTYLLLIGRACTYVPKSALHIASLADLKDGGTCAKTGR